jgi:endonuclease YncB( thermonuclease family)
MPAYPARGSTFTGVVSYVGDGDSFCVAVGARPNQWVEVRLADFYAPELNAAGGRDAKSALQKAVNGQRLTCNAGHRSYDRVVAQCRIRGRSVAEVLRAAGAVEGGNGRAGKPPVAPH